MGSGDARSRRGKLFRGSHGKTRPKGGKKKTTASTPPLGARTASRGKPRPG